MTNNFKLKYLKIEIICYFDKNKYYLQINKYLVSVKYV